VVGFGDDAAAFDGVGVVCFVAAHAGCRESVSELDAARAQAWGLVNHVVEPEELLPTCRALARDMASCVPEVLRGYKRLIDVGYGMSLSEALAFERRAGIESARAASSAEISRRRDGVQRRGRDQRDSKRDG